MQCYPTIPMLKMMLRRTELEKDGATEQEIIAFRQAHVFKTKLTKRESIILILALFLSQRHDNGDPEFKENIKALTQFNGVLGESLDAVGSFYCTLCDFYNQGRTVFYAVTSDDTAFEAIDLCEKPDEARFICVNECGGCKKQSSTLLECAKCHKAAYCDKTCQMKDLAFHREYCQYLASSTV